MGPTGLRMKQNLYYVTHKASNPWLLLSHSAHHSELNLWLLLLFGCSVMSDSLRPHGLRHTRPPCPSLSPRVCSNLCPLSQWCHPTISSFVIPFSSCLLSFPASRSFPLSRLFTSYWSFSISSSNEYSGQISFRMDWLVSLQSKGLLLPTSVRPVCA